MWQELLAAQAAPTLAGIKTGSLFPCPFASYESLRAEIRDCNRALRDKGLRLIPLRRSERTALLYLYRPERLRADLARPETAALLRRLGYEPGQEAFWLHELIRRLRRCESFPHEIGLFLSYPAEDVRGFMENRGRDCKCVGCWKVYGDVSRARATFGAYRACAELYRVGRAMGLPLRALTAGN